MWHDDSQAHSRPLTQEGAIAIAKQRIGRTFGEPENSWDRKQTRDLAFEMASRAVTESLRKGEGHGALEQKLSFCINLIENLKLVGRSTKIENVFWKSENERTPDEVNLVSLRHDTVWRRYRVADSFQLGPDSLDYFDGSNDTIVHMTAKYVSEPWARHPMVDWVLLDMMITREACMYGEQVKMNGLPGLNRGPVGFPLGYFKHNGNLQKMRADVPARFSAWLVKFGFGWVVPVGAIWAAFFYGFETTGFVLMALFALSVAWWLLMVAIRFGIQVYWYATGKTDPANRPLEILNAMREVWCELEGPVVNPSMVRGAMLKAKDLGAVWDGAAWAIIDRAVSIDPAVMVATTKSN